MHNSFISSFRNAFDTLSLDYNLPHFVLDKNNRCQINYNNEFDLIIAGHSQGCVQLKAHIASLNPSMPKDTIFEKLLEMNNTDPKMAGCFLGYSKKHNTISFNFYIYTQEIQITEFLSFVNNFLSRASDIRSDILESLGETSHKDKEANKIDTPMIKNHFDLLSVLVK